MSINSRQKGARAERALAKKLKEYGYASRRGQQFSGKNGDADVVGLPRIHIEAKHVERLQLWDAMAQSKNDAREGEKPVVMHKKNRTEWLVTMPLDEWIELYQAWERELRSKPKTEEVDPRQMNWEQYEEGNTGGKTDT